MNDSSRWVFWLSMLDIDPIAPDSNRLQTNTENEPVPNDESSATYFDGSPHRYSHPWQTRKSTSHHEVSDTYADILVDCLKTETIFRPIELIGQIHCCRESFGENRRISIAGSRIVHEPSWKRDVPSRWAKEGRYAPKTYRSEYWFQLEQRRQVREEGERSESSCRD